MRMDAEAWDARYDKTELEWSAGPNDLFAELTADLPPGRALDVAAGEGRNALWLAQRGWDVRAMDFSAVGLDKGKLRAAETGTTVDWVLADVTTADLGNQAFDLVAVLYLQLASAILADVLPRCAAAVTPGGTLLVLGHDRDNLTRGVGGPQDADLLHTVELLRTASRGLTIERLEQVDRQTANGVAIDTLLIAERPG